MHTLTGPEGTVFNFNSDGSGELVITSERPGRSPRSIRIPFKDVIALVAHHARCEFVATIEQMDDNEILALGGVAALVRGGVR